MVKRISSPTCWAAAGVQFAAEFLPHAARLSHPSTETDKQQNLPWFIGNEKLRDRGCCALDQNIAAASIFVLQLPYGFISLQLGFRWVMRRLDNLWRLMDARQHSLCPNVVTRLIGASYLS